MAASVFTANAGRKLTHLTADSCTPALTKDRLLLLSAPHSTAGAISLCNGHQVKSAHVGNRLEERSCDMCLRVVVSSML